MTPELLRNINTTGPHTSEVLNILREEISSQETIQGILAKAVLVIERSVDPNGGVPDHTSDGLLYGLIQSGKTSIITVAAALAADNGFHCIIILTSDIDLLYEQTLERVQKALRGLSVLGKNDWRDGDRFRRQIRTPPFVIVCSKNGNKLNSLLDAFRSARAGRLSTLIVDDEADQASLNTFTSKAGNQISRINEVITNMRTFFPVNTYLQVTATPQALFLQRPDHRYRPSFTVLSEPSPDYVGGEEFFGLASPLIRTVDLNEVNLLRVGNQPRPTTTVPPGLKRALYAFLVGATSRIIARAAVSYSFLCHVSVNTRDHQHIVGLLDDFKETTLRVLQTSGTNQHERVLQGLRDAHTDLATTQQNLPEFNQVVDGIRFYLRGASIRLINATSNEEIRLDAAFNLFVGGNKLGRGVTIRNLIVSYYGRNPQRPNSDTVLQHARMYGYRRRDLGVTRLFLPERLAENFRLIHQMENALRGLVQKHPEGNFEGLYISSPLQATRRNVLDPNSIGLYVAGGYCNPIYPLRTQDMAPNTQWLDQQLQPYTDAVEYYEVQINLVNQLLERCHHEPDLGATLWNRKTIQAALEKISTLKGTKAYLRVRRGRQLDAPRRETQGFLSGGEDGLVPRDALTLFMYRLGRSNKGIEVWWPMLRFPDGNYVIAFSFSR